VGTQALRVPVLACRDALVAGGAEVSTGTATSDAEIDAGIGQLDGRPRADGLTWAADSGDGPALVVAVGADAQVAAGLRRVGRRGARRAGPGVGPAAGPSAGRPAAGPHRPGPAVNRRTPARSARPHRGLGAGSRRSARAAA